MKRHRSTAVRFMGWLLAISCQSSWALDGLLNAEMDPSTTSLRSAAPLDMTWTVQWLGKSILEGHFDIEVRTGDQVVARCQSHDVVLAPGQQRIRVRVPSLGAQSLWDQPEVELRWVTQDNTLSVGTYLLTGRPGYRAFSICVCQGSEDRTSSNEDVLINSLHIEALVSKDYPVKLNTATTRWNRDDVPTNPLRFCAFDIVVATREGFAKLRAKQLDALDRWVRAGGSLCVLIGEPLPDLQLDFLNNLSAGEEGGTVFLNDGRVAPASERETDSGVWLTAHGLGQVAVVNGSIVSKSDAFDRHFRTIACTLWNVRHCEVDGILDNKKLGASPSDEALARQHDLIQQQMAMANQSAVTGGGELVSRLMPIDVRVVPLGLIAAVLVSYVVLIGPVDYAVLGYLKMRRWTWCTFPLVTLATTVLCMKISNSYLSSQDTGHTLTVRDVDASGHLVRDNQFRLVFTSTRREVTTTVQQMIFTVMDHQGTDAMYMRNRYMGGMNSMGVELPNYRGLYPVDFVVTQTVPQWTPLLYRTLSIPKEDRTIDFRWDKARGLLTSEKGRQELARVVQSSFGSQATAHILNQDLRFLLRAGVVQADGRRQLGHNQFANGRIDPMMPASIQSHLSLQPPFGLFRLISRVSSHGGDSFEDLAMLDSSDPSQWLLLITFDEQDDLVMLRRRYTGLTP
jgi:hypothetical protein